jgi:hypothetical protein
MAQDDDEERVSIPSDSEEARRALLKVDPEAPPAAPNEERPAPDQPAKDQGDALSER